MSQFYKVSYPQFEKDMLNLYPHTKMDNIKKLYDNIKLPRRATTGSAGYDFFAPYGLLFEDWEDLIVPTGIKVVLSTGHFLMIAPRSGLGFRHYLRLANTVGVIDEDYALSNNEGHIFIKLRCEQDKISSVKTIEQGDAFAQGIIIPYAVTKDDYVKEKRVGGLGSTNGTLQAQMAGILPIAHGVLS